MMEKSIEKLKELKAGVREYRLGVKRDLKFVNEEIKNWRMHLKMDEFDSHMQRMRETHVELNRICSGRKKTQNAKKTPALPRVSTLPRFSRESERKRSLTSVSRRGSILKELILYRTSLTDHDPLNSGSETKRSEMNDAIQLEVSRRSSTVLPLCDPQEENTHESSVVPYRFPAFRRSSRCDGSVHFQNRRASQCDGQPTSPKRHSSRCIGRPASPNRRSSQCEDHPTSPNRRSSRADDHVTSQNQRSSSDDEDQENPANMTTSPAMAGNLVVSSLSGRGRDSSSPPGQTDQSTQLPQLKPPSSCSGEGEHVTTSARSRDILLRGLVLRKSKNQQGRDLTGSVMSFTGSARESTPRGILSPSIVQLNLATPPPTGRRRYKHL